LITSLTTLEKLFPRFIVSRSRSSFKLQRGVLARTYSGYGRVNVHWTTLWIRRSPKNTSCLGDFSTTDRRLPRIAGVVITLMIPVNLLTIVSQVRNPVRLVLRYLDRGPAFNVLRNPVRIRGGGPHCSVGALPL
jgi:hypothetical protein